MAVADGMLREDGRNSIFPAAKQQKGYINGYFLVDAQEKKGVAFSFWESEADLAAIADNGFYKEQVAKVIPHLDGQPKREVYEVKAQS